MPTCLPPNITRSGPDWKEETGEEEATGLFDVFKKTKPAPETVKGPTTLLREAGYDTYGLKCKIGADGSVSVSGTCDSGETRDGIISTLEGMPNVARVVNEINVAAPEPDPVAEEPAAEEVPAGDVAQAEGRTYTVQSDDTLWKISQEMYGNGSKYMKIFEANTPMLEDPGKIYPGQVLVIPDLDQDCLAVRFSRDQRPSGRWSRMSSKHCRPLPRGRASHNVTATAQNANEPSFSLMGLTAHRVRADARGA